MVQRESVIFAREAENKEQQGETRDDLKDHLRDLYADVSGGQLPGIRKVDDLVVS